MKKKTFYIVAGLILLVIIGFIVYTQYFANQPPFPNETNEVASLVVSETKSEESSACNEEKKDRSLEIFDFEGVWHGVRFEKDNTSDREYPFSDNYAQQFARYASFSVYGDSLFVFGRCRQKVYLNDFPVELKVYLEQTPFVLHFKPQSERVYLITPSNKSAANVCLEGYSAVYIHGDQLVITDRGYFFYFERGVLNSDYKITGMPGDTRSAFVAERTFGNNTFDNVYKQFLNDFPYERDLMLPELPDEDYNTQEPFIDYSYWGDGNLRVYRVVPQGMVMLELVHKDDEILLKYFLNQEHN